MFSADLANASHDSNAKEEAAEFLINLPNVERINELKYLMSVANQEEVERQLQKRIVRSEVFDKDFKHGKDDVNETPDMPGASSSKDHARLKALNIIKVEMEQNEEIDYEKIGITVLLAFALSVAVQWLFEKCMKWSKRNNQPKPEARIKTIKAHGEESLDEFELISNNEVEDEEEPQTTQEVEDDQKKRKEAEKDQKAEATLIALKDLIKAADKNEKILFLKDDIKTSHSCLKISMKIDLKSF